MNLPIGLGDRVDAEQTALAALVDDLGAAAAQAMAVDAAVDHDVGHVHALGAVLARHALRDHAQARLGGGELGKPGLPGEAAGRTGEDPRAPAGGDEPAGRLAADEKARKAADPPEFLELLRRGLAEVDVLIDAGVEDDDVGRI